MACFAYGALRVSMHTKCARFSYMGGFHGDEGMLT